MITSSGKRVFPSGHKLHDGSIPTIEDIARGLSRQARFCGQTNQFYSVLAHSFVVASILPSELSFFGLMHDAHEAIMSDVPTPWKDDVRQKQEDELEALIVSSIAEDMGIDMSKNDAALVKLADTAALKAEAHLLGHSASEEFWPKQSFSRLDVEAMIHTHEMIASGASYEMLLDAGAAIDAFVDALHGTLAAARASEK